VDLRVKGGCGSFLYKKLGGTVRASVPLTESAPEEAHLPVAAGRRRLISRRGVDEAFLVVRLAPLEVVDLSMASLRRSRRPFSGRIQMNIIRTIRFVKRCSRCGTSFSTSTSSSPTKKPRHRRPAGRRSSTSSRTARGITLKVELPEVDANDVDIQLEGNALTVRGERKLENVDKQEGYHRVERSYGAFSAGSRCPRQWRRETSWRRAAMACCASSS